MKTKILVLALFALLVCSNYSKADGWKHYHSANGVEIYSQWKKIPYSDVPWLILKIVNTNSVKTYVSFDVKFTECPNKAKGHYGNTFAPGDVEAGELSGLYFVPCTAYTSYRLEDLKIKIKN